MNKEQKALVCLFLVFCPCIWAQMPILVDASRSLEAMQQQESVLKSEALEVTPPLTRWRHQGLGRISYVSDGQLCLLLPVETGKRAQGPADDPDYATLGRASAVFDLHHKDLEEYNRVAMEVFPRCEGTVVMNLNLFLHDAENGDLGAHLVNLKNNQWNHVVYDISGVGRRDVSGLEIYTDLKGRNLARGDSIAYHIRNIRFERVGHSEPETGWQPEQGHISYPFSGYFPQGRKTAIVALPERQKGGESLDGTSFQLVDAANGKTVFNGVLKESKTTIGSFGVMDFSSFAERGDYLLKCDNMETSPFHIGDDVFLHAKELLMNFIFCQRCGYAVPGIHGACHEDVFCNFKVREVSYGGGWHDAGDLSQQTLQTCETATALLELWHKTHDKGSACASRLLEEAMWGLRFVLHCRLGDGYHASSMGLLHWTDGIAGTEDDIHTVRSQNVAYDNFLYAGCEAYAARVMPSSPLRDSLAKAAREDFHFATDKFEREGYDVFPHVMEHTYNTSPSQYHATMSWAASQLFMLTGEEKYGVSAVESVGYLLECQEGQGVLPGYFYRDKTRRSIVHYIHQSREQLFMQAFVSLCESQPTHEDYGRWQRAIRLYGNYLKSLVSYIEPYGMAASGVYLPEEYADSAGFHSLHIFSTRDAYASYDSQLEKGVKLDDGHYVRRFPIWFNIFNGNEAVILSMGKAAALCGHFLKDDSLLQVGREQLYWTVGKNPFRQSLIYGEGWRYPSMDSFSSGEMMGEIPVGIRSWGDEDIPYWPHTNNACYKEVWTTSAAKFLSLLAEYEDVY